MRTATTGGPAPALNRHAGAIQPVGADGTGRGCGPAACARGAGVRHRGIMGR